MKGSKAAKNFFSFKYYTYTMKNNFSLKKNITFEKQEMDILENKKIISRLNQAGPTFLLLKIKKARPIEIDTEKLINEIAASPNFLIENAEFLKYSLKLIKKFKNS